MKVVALLLPLVLLTACASSDNKSEGSQTTSSSSSSSAASKSASSDKAANAADNRECVKNVTKTGNFFVGQNFKTSATVNGVSKKAAVDRIFSGMVEGGWTVVYADKELGSMSARIPNGLPSTLTIGVHEQKGGAKLILTFASGREVGVDDEKVVQIFCSIVDEAAGGKTPEATPTKAAPAKAPAKKPSKK